MKIELLIVLVLVFQTIFANSNEFKLSDSKILLPRTSYLSVNYTISGSPTICHEWSSSATEVVTITPIYNDQCSSSAIITSVWQSNFRGTATIYAKNVATSHIVKCDVIVDLITKLEIETRTLELYLHETPESLIARAYDEFGNTFSSLDGIPFEWSISSSGKDYQNVLRFITWTESEYTTPTLIGSLERQGLQGYKQLVSGLKTGSANVVLMFRDDKLSKSEIKSNGVKLLVMANAALSPQLAYLIPYTELNYNIIVHSQGSYEEVILPSLQYYLKVNDSSIAKLEDKSSTITALKYGQTEVILIDRNINEEFRHPTSLVYVKEPGFLSFYISPGDNQWILQSQYNNTYIITVRPFDFNSHALYMSDNLRLNTTIPKEYFKVLFSSKNGTYHIVEAIKEGYTTLKSRLSYILLKNNTQHKLSMPVDGSQDLVIYPPIKVEPKLVLLPWYWDMSIIPGYQLIASGGSGEYKWFTCDEHCHHKSTPYTHKSNSHQPSVTVDSKGFVRPIKLGTTNVVAGDQRNLLNRGSSRVIVDQIYRIAFILEKVEVEVGHQLDLSLAAFNKDDKLISHCHWLPFITHLLDTNNNNNQNIKIKSNVKASPKGSNSCAIVQIVGVKPGFATIRTKLDLKSNDTNTLTTSITVGVYYPTKFVDPKLDFSILAVKSTRVLKITNGPLPWIMKPESYYYQMEENSNSKTIVNKINLRHQTEYANNDVTMKQPMLFLSLQCIDIGEVIVNITIGNKATLKNPQPVKSVGQLKFICTIPTGMKLVPKLLISNRTKDCPFQNFTELNDQLTISNKRSLIVEVHFIDKDGQVLDKSESLGITVYLSSIADKSNTKITDIVETATPKVVYISDNKNKNSETDSVYRSHFLITPKHLGHSLGLIAVIVKCTSFRDSKFSITSFNQYNLNLESKLMVKLSKSISVEPDKLLIYQHDKISVKFTVKYGSGFFYINHWSTSQLKVSLIDTTADQRVYVVIQSLATSSDDDNTSSSRSHDRKATTSASKMKNSGQIQITDLCFASLTHSDSIDDNTKFVSLELIKPKRIQIYAINKIEIGDQIIALLKVFDDNGREFPQQYLNLLKYHIHINGINDNNKDSKQSYPTKHGSSNMRPESQTPVITVYSESSSSSSSTSDWLIPLSDDVSIPTSHTTGYYFKINGEKVGFSSFFITLDNDKDVISNSITIEVFEPLKLVPNEIVLLPGAEIQLTTTGGPMDCQNNLLFSVIANKSLGIKQADIVMLKNGPNGLVKAIKEGKYAIKVRAEIFEIDPINNNIHKILSKDVGLVGVVQIQSMHIHTPTNRLLVGNTIPLWVTFTIPSDHELSHLPITGFSMTGTRHRSLAFRWSLNPPTGVTAELNHALQMSSTNTGIDIDDNYLHSGMRLTGMVAGKQTIELIAIGLPLNWLSVKSTNQLSAKVVINIVSKLDMLYPQLEAKTLLLPPSITIALRTTLDNSAAVSYSITPLPDNKEYQQNRMEYLSKSKFINSYLHSSNILETSCHYDSFILHVTSTHQIDSLSLITNQTLAIHVTVKPPLYSMINPYSTSTNDDLFYQFMKRYSSSTQSSSADNSESHHETINKLPLGGPFNFEITSHDDLGNQFDVSPDMDDYFQYRLHRNDHITLTITTETFLITDRQHKLMHLQAMKSGDNTIQCFINQISSIASKSGAEHDSRFNRNIDQTHIRLQDRSYVLTDIISLPTGSVLKIQGVENQDKLFAIEGSRLKFHSPLTFGQWHSSDEEVAKIDTRTGETVLFKQGATSIFYSMDNNNVDAKSPTLSKKSHNVLLANELLVHPISQINLHPLDQHSGDTSVLHNSYQFCDHNINQCLPISFNMESKLGYLIGIYLFSAKSIVTSTESSSYQSDQSNNQTYNTNKWSLNQFMPLECSGLLVDSHTLMSASSLNQHHNSLLVAQLFDITTVAIPSEVNSNFGLKQWGCLVKPKTISSQYSKDIWRLFRSFLIQPTDWSLQIHAKLRGSLDHSITQTSHHTVSLVTGYILLPLPANEDMIQLTEVGQVSTHIRLVLSSSTRALMDGSSINSNLRLSVVSSKPHRVEVLAPRLLEQGADPISSEDESLGLNIWIYPLKVSVTDRVIDEKLTIHISLPITKQKNQIVVQLKIRKPSSSNIIGKSPSSNESDELAAFNWLPPVIVVLVTAIIAVGIVMLVNYFLRPLAISKRSAQCCSLPNIPVGTPLNRYSTNHVWTDRPWSGGGGGSGGRSYSSPTNDIIPGQHSNYHNTSFPKFSSPSSQMWRN